MLPESGSIISAQSLCDFYQVRAVGQRPRRRRRPPHRRRRAVHRLDGGEEPRAARQLPVADFARPFIGILAALPLAGAAPHKPHAFLRGDEQLVLGVVVPVDRLEVVARVREVGRTWLAPHQLGFGKRR